MTLAAQKASTTEFPHYVRAIPDGQVGVDVMMRRVSLEVRYTNERSEQRGVCRGLTAAGARSLARQLLAAADFAEGR